MTIPELNPDTDQPTRAVVFRLRVIALIATVVIFVIATTVFTISKQSIYEELEITIVLVAVTLFSFLFYALYRGATIVGKPTIPRLKFVDPGLADALPVDFLDLGGSIGSILAWIVVTILFTFLLAVVFSALWSALLLLVFVLYWLFWRALRIVLVNAAKCRGDLSLSIRYALTYTILYTGWMYAITWIREFYLTQGL